MLDKLAAEMDQDDNVARILMSSLTLIRSEKSAPAETPVDWPDALGRMLATFGYEGRESFSDYLLGQFVSPTARLRQLPLARLAPTNVEQARECLNTVISNEFYRIREIRAQLEAINEADPAGAPARLWFETGPEGENSRRYVLSHKRVLNRSISNLITARTRPEAGAFDRVQPSLVDAESAGNKPVVVAPAADDTASADEPGNAGTAATIEPTAAHTVAAPPLEETSGARNGRHPANTNQFLPNTCGNDSDLRNEATDGRMRLGPGVAESLADACGIGLSSSNSNETVVARSACVERVPDRANSRVLSLPVGDRPYCSTP